MPTLFTSLTSETDLRAAAIICDVLGRDQYDRVAELFNAIEPGVSTVPLSGVKPDVAAFWSEHYVIVVASGTENLFQLIDTAAKLVPTRHPPYVGKMNPFWASRADAVRADIGEEVLPLLPTRTLVLIGHSAGAAMVQVLASVWAPLAARCFCYCFGSPRPGDPELAASINQYVINVQNDLDAVTILPPRGEELSSVILRYLRISDAVHNSYVDVGTLAVLKRDGSLSGGPQPDVQFWKQFLTGGFNTHPIDVYRAWLTFGAPDPFTPVQVTKPRDWNDASNYLPAPPTINILPTVPPGQGELVASPLCAGSFFFKSLDRTFGWTESWYANISVSAMITAMRNLTNQRLAFLAPDCCIYWYRASIVEKGVPRASQLFKRNTVAKGTATPTGTAAGDNVAMTMDCIVGKLVSSAGSVRQEKWRGLPDEYLQGDGLSPAGVGALDIIGTYLQAVQAAGLGMRRQLMTVADEVPIAGMSVAANGNINLNCPGHGFLDTSPFTCLIRGRTLANPKLRAPWNISVIDANTLQCVSSTTFGPGSGGPGGTVTRLVVGADSLDFPAGESRLFAFNQTSAIKTGRPADLHHGKRSAVLKHR